MGMGLAKVLYRTDGSIRSTYPHGVVVRFEDLRPISIIRFTSKESDMSLGTILLIVLILFLVGAFPSWPHSKSWGYGPSGGLGLIVLILLILLLMGRI